MFKSTPGFGRSVWSFHFGITMFYNNVLLCMYVMYRYRMCVSMFWASYLWARTLLTALTDETNVSHNSSHSFCGHAPSASPTHRAEQTKQHVPEYNMIFQFDVLCVYNPISICTDKSYMRNGIKPLEIKCQSIRVLYAMILWTLWMSHTHAHTHIYYIRYECVCD